MDMNVHYTTDNQFTSYSDASVTIKGEEYRKNILVTNDNIIAFAHNDIKQITVEGLTDVLAFEPDLVIFGTGDKIVYPDLKLLYELQRKQIGVEVMPIQALCRTFNFLVSENRKVACILLFPHNN